MSKVTIKLNTEGVRQLLQSEEMQDELEKHATQIVNRCNGSYEINTYQGKNRSNVSIITRDSKTFNSNLKDNELLRALR